MRNFESNRRNSESIFFMFQVEKKEKKRRPTGRAKRRMQYNRRFVNVVTVPGRRRGPNANVVA